MEFLKRFDTLGLIIILSLVVLDGFFWFTIFRESAAVRGTRDYFLDVGQGDGELMVFEGNIKVMTDAGPDNKVVASLGKVMPAGDRYIDVAIIFPPPPAPFYFFAY